MGGVDFALIGREEARSPWRATVGESVWELPHLADLTIGDQLAVESMSAVALAFVARKYGQRVLEDGSTEPAGEDLAEALLDCRREGLAAFVVAYLADAGLEPGESPASSRSPRSTARP